jgi:hypothetical protein
VAMPEVSKENVVVEEEKTGQKVFEQDRSEL